MVLAPRALRPMGQPRALARGRTGTSLSLATTGSGVAPPAGVLGLAAARTAALASNPQNAGLSSTTATVSVATAAPTATFPTQYPATQTAAGWQAATDLEGGLSYIVGGRLNLYAASQGGFGTVWTAGSTANLRVTQPRVSFKFTDTDFAFATADGGAGVPRWFRVLVNGQYLSKAGYAASPGADFSARCVTVTLSAAVTNATVTLEFNQDTVHTYLVRRSADTMAKPGVTKPGLLIVGDSISAGGINNAVWPRSPSTGPARRRPPARPRHTSTRTAPTARRRARPTKRPSSRGAPATA